MKKSLAPVLASFTLLLFGSAFAQTSQSHEVRVELPGLLMIRLVEGPSNAVVTNPSAVEFDLSALTAASFNPTGTYAPTNAAAFNWDDVVVLSNGGAWEVTVSLSSDVGGFDWSKVDVGGLFSLVDGDVIDAGLGSTLGFESLGFGPQDFELTLDGSETAGLYSVTVTYEIAAP